MPEVEEKTDLDRRGAQIVQQLNLVARLKGPGGLEFDDNLSIDNEVGFQNANELASEVDRHTCFPLEGDTALSEDNGETIRTNCFREAKPELVVSLEERPDYAPSQLATEQLSPSSRHASDYESTPLVLRLSIPCRRCDFSAKIQ